MILEESLVGSPLVQIVWQRLQSAILQPTFSKEHLQYTDIPTATNGTTSSEPRIVSYTYHVYGGTSLSPCSTCNTSGISSQTHPEGAKANRPHANPKNAIFLPMFSLLRCGCCRTTAAAKRLGSHGTTAALQIFPSVTSGASDCGFGSVCVCVSL